MPDSADQQKKRLAEPSVIQKILRLLFAARGRLNPKGFYLCQAVIAALIFPEFLLMSAAIKAENFLTLVGISAFVLAGVLFWIFVTSLHRRWDDIEPHSEWHYLTLFGAVCAIGLRKALPNGLPIILVVLAFGYAPSNPNPNKYGRPPYDGWFPPV